MLRHTTRFTLCILLVLFLFPAQARAAETAQFLSIIDGDSLLVNYGGSAREVRLIGIDAPEWGQEFGTRAKSFAMSLCFGKQLRLEFDRERKDRYGRLLAYAYCDDRMLNLEMVRAGMAVAIKVKPNTRHFKQLKQAEKKARAERRGFWLHGGLKQSPAQWRKQHKR